MDAFTGPFGVPALFIHHVGILPHVRGQCRCGQGEIHGADIGNVLTHTGVCFQRGIQVKTEIISHLVAQVELRTSVCQGIGGLELNKGHDDIFAAGTFVQAGNCVIAQVYRANASEHITLGATCPDPNIDVPAPTVAIGNSRHGLRHGTGQRQTQQGKFW